MHGRFTVASLVVITAAATCFTASRRHKRLAERFGTVFTVRPRLSWVSTGTLVHAGLVTAGLWKADTFTGAGRALLRRCGVRRFFPTGLVTR